MWKCRYIKLYLKLQAHPCLGKITSSQKKYKQYIQNLSKIDQKSALKTLLEGSWRLLGASWRALGGLLGGSWGALGAILAHLGSKTLKKSPPAKLRHEFWRGLGPPNPPKSNKNQHKINKNIIIFGSDFLIDFMLIDVGFGWISGPKTIPKLVS